MTIHWERSPSRGVVLYEGSRPIAAWRDPASLRRALYLVAGWGRDVPMSPDAGWARFTPQQLAAFCADLAVAWADAVRREGG